ncbi:IRC5 [Candida oxycetoniae]|uniref:IRC5 n=1 Tax=Candida oxycetoniae TaxID=497107 RepID=A0AAI9SYP5_9ASCO|nr:IRC5 [Candida oxycetoniae]KAI3405653.2 IRC5 [Candida oxycetoniae]
MLSDEEDETSLKSLVEELQSKQENSLVYSNEQDEFNRLSKKRKLDRLNNLIEKSQIYSKIIADNILQTTLENQKQPQEKAVVTNDDNDDNDDVSQQKKKRRKTNNRKLKQPKRDIVAMMSTKISESTKTTRDQIEKSQSYHSTVDEQQQQQQQQQKQPKLITGGTLKNYQLDGLEWLVTLYQNGLNGILADEMGLGKTLQCIAFLSFLIENGLKGPFLVVVPLSTLSNWFNEITRFAPKIKVLKYSGSKQERSRIDLFTTKANIVITSYEISIKDFSKFSAINWQYLIVDEGHRLKNNQCLLIKVLKKLVVTNRLLITGTPLQNNLNELWSLLNFILPDIFHDLELFQQWFNFDELTKFEQDEEQDEETRKLIKYNIQETLIKNLHTILKPFILRRLKKDVIRDLPPKKEYLIHIPLTNLQKKIYLDALNGQLQAGLIESNLKEYIEYNHCDLFTGRDRNIIDVFLKAKKSTDPTKKRLLKKISYQEEDSEEEFYEDEAAVDDDDDDDDDDDASNETYEQVLLQLPKLKTKRDKQQLILTTLYKKITSRIKHLNLQALRLIQLRNICNSPYLYYEPFPIDSQHDTQFMTKLVENSCKFQALEVILIPLITSRQHHKCLLFSQFTKVLDLIHDWLTWKGFEVCRLDGSTPQQEREEQIQLFNDATSPFKVFLLSTRAGGLGINLVGADTVILFDNDWNPQMDLQAIDRVHRIGQTKPVKIFRFVVRDSIEEILISKSSSKRFLEKLVIQMGEFKFNKIKQMIGNDDGKELEVDLKELLEMSKHNFRYRQEEEKEEEKEEEEVDGKDNKFNLSKEESDELFDRSRKCYSNTDDSRFKNVTIFETVNNMDK